MISKELSVNFWYAVFRHCRSYISVTFTYASTIRHTSSFRKLILAGSPKPGCHTCHVRVKPRLQQKACPDTLPARRLSLCLSQFVMIVILIAFFFVQLVWLILRLIFCAFNDNYLIIFCSIYIILERRITNRYMYIWRGMRWYDVSKF